MAEHPFVAALKKRRQIAITVTGRRTGRPITVPVWFVHDEDTVWLLPVHGSQTQWYRNLQKNRAIAIQAGKERLDLKARLLKRPESVGDVIRRFREKYTPDEIERWYTRLDVALQIPLYGRSAQSDPEKQA